MAANLSIIDPDVIAVGQTIVIPSAREENARPTVIAETRIYTVRRGDTLSIIAKRYDLALNKLLEANREIEDPDRIRLGQQIIIPAGELRQPGDPVERTSVPSSGDSNAILARCRPAGASGRTARQDKLRVTGVEASKRMAETDARMVLPYMSKFDEAARLHNLPPALLAGIASRESRGGAVLDRNGEGDHGHGFGLMQVDNRNPFPVAREGGPFGQPHINQATGILADKLAAVKRSFPNLSEEEQLQTAVSRYNGGAGQPHPNSDVGTTGGDYSNDVLARAQYYAERWHGVIAPTVTTPASAVHDATKGFTPAPSLDEVQAGNAVLRVGHRGPAVERVQEFLGNIESDGLFGDDTHDAVLAFQQAHNIKPPAGSEGAIDKTTLEILGTVHAARPVRKGDVIFGRHRVSDQRIKDLLQAIANHAGSRVILTSGDRKRVVNSNSRSHHLVGRAADFFVEGLTLSEAFHMLKDTVIPRRDFQFIYHTEVTTAPHLHIGRYADNRPSSFIIDTGQILPRRK
jgi:LysM repeat protein/peptidoglycan hydrolase-like protein with peptidoglycan-binding domain